MASTTSPPDKGGSWVGRVVQHQEFARALAERRALSGEPAMPRNAGNGRTPSKRALLKAIKDAGGTW